LIVTIFTVAEYECVVPAGITTTSPRFGILALSECCEDALPEFIEYGAFRRTVVAKQFVCDDKRRAEQRHTGDKMVISR
jgi:hypothetical protein